MRGVPGVVTILCIPKINIHDSHAPSLLLRFSAWLSRIKNLRHFEDQESHSTIESLPLRFSTIAFEDGASHSSAIASLVLRFFAWLSKIEVLTAVISSRYYYVLCMSFEDGDSYSGAIESLSPRLSAWLSNVEILTAVLSSR